MNETDITLLDEFAAYFNSIKRDFWIDIHELRFWKSGDRIFLDFHLIIPFFFNIKESHTEENEIEKQLQEKFDNVQLKIHFDYCNEDLCKYCKMPDCIYRTENKRIDFSWDTKKLSGKPIYTYP
jgi:hypothetical protein